MIEILQFIFESFWHFIGTVILLGMLCAPFATFAEILARRRK